MLKFIPTEIAPFNSYINKTDDCKNTIYERTVIPKGADGEPDFSNHERNVVKQAAWKFWSWTEEESNQWSLFRQRNNELYSEYNSLNKKNDSAKLKILEESLNKNISECNAYEIEHRLVMRMASVWHSLVEDLEIFGIKQDVLQYKTSLRTITLHYEKQIPLTEYEKDFIEKYRELHEQTIELNKNLRKEIKELKASLPGLWEKIFINKEKADKASNTICLPPAEMEGSFSPWVYAYVPTKEEQQILVDDCNSFADKYYKEVDELCNKSNAISNQLYGDDEVDESKKTLQDEVDEMQCELNDNNYRKKYSIEPATLRDDDDSFRGAYDDEHKKTMLIYDEYDSEYGVFMDVHNALTDFLNVKFAPKEQKEEKSPGFFDSEPDDLQAETIHNYESGMGSPYMDVDDWHIILNNYERKYDEKNQAIALEKALTQHPENATLLLRKALEEMSKHDYQKALALVKQVEDAGAPFHPNFYFVKGDIFCNVYAPEKAIPLYNKVLNSKGGEELETFKEKARNRLIDIYENEDNYSECIRLCKELIEKHPDDEQTVADLSRYYLLSGMFNEAEEIVKSFIEKFPKSSICKVQLGEVYFETKDFEKAAGMFLSAYNDNQTDNYGDLYPLGHTFIKLKRFDEAVVCFETYLFHYHLDKKNHIAAAQCYVELKMPYAAAYHYRKALDLDSNCTEAMQYLQQQRN